VLNDNQSYSAGAYADWQPGPFLHVQPRAGYALYHFQQAVESYKVNPNIGPGLPIFVPAGESIQTSDIHTWYADLTVSHQVSKAATYALSAGREIRLGVEGDVIQDWYFRPNITWTIFKEMKLNTSLFYEHGNQGLGNGSGSLTEKYNWYGGGLRLGYPLMKKLMVGLNYRLTLRSSNIPDWNYAQNIVGITLSYQPQ
jgi:hypothetical protein